MRRGTGTGSSPLGCLGGLIALVLAPWLFQRHMNRESTMGASRMADESEHLWRKIGLIAAGVIIAGFILAKRAGWFADWMNW